MLFALEVILFFVCALAFAAYLSLLERKLIARIQLRLGPDKCGYVGVLQPIADALKLLFKREPFKGHAPIATVCVGLLLFLSLLQLTIIPCLNNNRALLECDCNLLLAILFHSAIVLCEVLLGLVSGSKFGVIGGSRAYLQHVGVHVPYILLIACVMAKANVASLVRCPPCPVLQNPVLFVTAFITLLIATNKAPFDFPEAESELVGGAYVEYGGILFGVIYLSDYLNLMFMASLLTAIFFGGCSVAFLLKATLIIGLVIAIRATLPRLRQDQMLRLAWFVLTPILIVHLLISV